MFSYFAQVCFQFFSINNSYALFKVHTIPLLHTPRIRTTRSKYLNLLRTLEVHYQIPF